MQMILLLQSHRQWCRMDLQSEIAMKRTNLYLAIWIALYYGGVKWHR